VLRLGGERRRFGGGDFKALAQRLQPFEIHVLDEAIEHLGVRHTIPPTTMRTSMPVSRNPVYRSDVTTVLPRGDTLHRRWEGISDVLARRRALPSARR
jgi:hypothetical protein